MRTSARGSREAALAASSGSTATTKLLPPVAPSSLLRRERLLARLDEALERRLTTVVAEAGYGKSTLLAAWIEGVHAAWYGATPEDAALATFARGLTDALRLRVPGLPADLAGAVTAASGPGADQDELMRARGLAALVCETLQAELQRDLVLVVDDVQEVTGSGGSEQLVEALCRQAPARLHLVLATRSELPFPIERLRGRGQVLELGGADLSFEAEETAALLESVAGSADEGSAAEIHEASGGWPAAVRLAAETLREAPPERRASVLERVRQPGGALYSYLAAEVFAHEPPEVASLVRLVAPLDRFTPDLCTALGAATAPEILDSLARRGLFVEVHGQRSRWYSLGAAVREFARAELGDGDPEARTVRLDAARWFDAAGHTEEALSCFAAAGELDEVAAILREHGSALLAHGSVDAVLDAVELLPEEERDAAIDQLAGEALQVRGRWDEALRAFARASRDADPVPAALAWRIGLLHHLRGELDLAMETYHRGEEDGEAKDVALLLAWRASAHWLRAEADECRADARRAFEIAAEAGDPQSLAAAHTVLAMLAALEGDRGANDAHYLRALDYATQAGDVLQVIRVRTNRGSRHLEEGAYEEAIAELDLALRLADIAGFAVFRALALTNRGEAHAKRARFEEAVADLEAARALYQGLGSRMVAYPLEKLGGVYRERGEWALARAAYEEARARTSPTGDLQGLVPTLAGLARVLIADDPEEARAVAAEALALGDAMGRVHALLAAGWVALARGEREEAEGHAGEAASAAGIRRDRAALAEALEMRALAASDPAAELSRLDEAASIWRALENPVGEARALLVAATLRSDAAAAEQAEARLRSLGARGYRTVLARVLPAGDHSHVTVQSLGRFRVLRGGEPVAPNAWQSRKARDLLKILVARRGRPTPRDYLMEALWPDEGPERLGNRLSVLLSTVRAVLDPGKEHEPDRFVGADKSAIWMQAEHVETDVERFLSSAAEALARARAGEDARELLEVAEAAYAGDFLEEDAYEDWAVPLREEARATYVELARALAEDAAASGDADASTRFYLRVLERDGYDESAHLGLVTALEAARRHGEARRVYQAYCARMDEIGVESAPFPAPPAA